MATQSKFRNALLTTVALLGMGLPLTGLLSSNPAMAQQMLGQASSTHHQKRVKLPVPQKAPAPTLMESYFFNYRYTNPPIINGVQTSQGYLGSGFAPAGTYKAGQTVTISDNFGRPIGTYTIGTVNNAVPLDQTKLNTVMVSEYDYMTQRLIAGTGLVANTGSNGLGSESGSLTGYGAFGTNVIFNNQHTAINPIHF